MYKRTINRQYDRMILNCLSSGARRTKLEILNQSMRSKKNFKKHKKVGNMGKIFI